MSISALSDEDLRRELISFGCDVGPISEASRGLYEKRLEKLRAKASGEIDAKPARRQSSRSPARSKDLSPKRSPKKSPVYSTTTASTLVTPSGRKTVPRSEVENPEPNRVDDSFETDSPSVPNETSFRKTNSNTKTIFDTSYRTDDISSAFHSLFNKPISSPSDSVPHIVQRRKPTPPRSNYLHGTSGMGSYTSGGVSLRSAFSSPSESAFGVNTARRSDRDQGYNSSSRFRNTNLSFTNQSTRYAESSGDSEWNDEEDDHTESSRVLSKDTSFSPRKYRSPHQSWTTMVGAQFSALFTKITESVTEAKKQWFGNSHKSYPLARSSVGVSHLQKSDGFDISKALVNLLLFTFCFLLVAYTATAHKEALISSAIVIRDAAADTVHFLYNYAVIPIIIITFVVGCLAALYVFNLQRITARKREMQLVFALVEKITDIVRDASEAGEDYVPEPHVRDMLIPVSKRIYGSPEWNRWQEAVKFINMNESRISTESRMINGTECAVWRWISAKKSGWQGNAFEGSSQLNVPDHALAHCLKLRGMFPSTLPSGEGRNVEKSIRQKLAPIVPLHIYVDVGSKEGIVFARFATLDDCKAAFTALHGSWFNGGLVSAKYLRDERYEQRFPRAPRA
ncbi:hypothetical protein AB6A40_000194 [Gnathostoma spinigerum]|uniref:LEM domain-containing protein n=1 Tax=Gnathostoma spinigerum TaxID=75299 RepID=A0ABD6EB07_9BILA